MNPKLRVHVIMIALNESVFIESQLRALYPFCERISIITQYDRDWYGEIVKPDRTSEIVLGFPDPEGKIHFIVRRLPDEAAARNMEMISFNKKSYANVLSHGRSMEDIAMFHSQPDYFWIIDADEIYDIETIPAILEYLDIKKPRGMRITGYNYLRTWNKRVPRTVIDFTHFGFIKAGILFEQRRVISWSEFRLAKLFRHLKLPDWSGRVFGFINCPESVGVFHHGCWLGNDERIRSKFNKSSHKESQQWQTNSIDEITFVHVPTNELPVNIQKGDWPAHFFND